MDKRISASEARKRFSKLLGQARYGGVVTIIERSGKPMAAMVPIELYERLVAEREARFEVLERIRSRAPDRSPDEVERDVTEAIAAIRAGGA